MTSEKNRVYGLDIMRAVAILAVMQAHGTYLVLHYLTARQFNPPQIDGVSIFFVLSGFLIGRILIDMFVRGRVTMRDVAQFWIRRWFRTLPTYYLVLLLLIGIYWSRYHFYLPAFTNLLTFTQNINHGPSFFFEEAWSLSVEEWFYLAVPPVMFLVCKFAHGARHRAILCVIAGVIIASLAIRVWTAVRLGYFFKFAGVSWTENITMPVINRFESIMLGVLGAYLMKYRPGPFQKHAGLLLVAGIVLTFLTNYRLFLPSNFAALFANYVYVTALGIGALLTIPKLSSIKSGSGTIYRIITFISKISYPMYLTNLHLSEITLLPWASRLLHLPSDENIFNWPSDGTPFECFARLALWWIITLGVSFAIHKLFEMPVMNLRERIRFDKKIEFAALEKSL